MSIFPQPPSGIGAVGSVLASDEPNQPSVVLAAPLPVTMIDPSIVLDPRMSRLPATTTPVNVLGALAGSVNEPISILVCGQIIVAVASKVLLNIVAPVNSHELAKWEYAVGTSLASGPLNVQLLKRRLLPLSKACELTVVSV